MPSAETTWAWHSSGLFLTGVPLLVVLIPWSAVNLADYFLVRRGRYDVASFFTAEGAYGRFAWRGAARLRGRASRRIAGRAGRRQDRRP